MNWKESTKYAILRLVEKSNSNIVTRKDLISKELKNIVNETKSSGETPEQTLSQTLQELEKNKFLRFLDKGVYEIINNFIYPDEIQHTKYLFEGAKKQVTVNIYERDTKARQECIDKYGYNCTICNFNFKKIYGDIGKNFIHVHHIKPLSEIKKKYKVKPIEDLRPVCPNCHAMLHKKNPAYSIQEIQNLLGKKLRIENRKNYIYL